MKENYYEKAISFDSLYKALQVCSRGVKWKDGVGVYCSNALKNTHKLRDELVSGKYRIRPYHYFEVTDPKKREVMATSIRDRQFQRSLCDNGLYEDLTEHFIYDNAACQKGKGTDFALTRLEGHLRSHYRRYGTSGYVLICDIRHFFAETGHDVAKAAVRKRISDDRAYDAVCQIIDSFPGEKGIGLGSQVSQLVQLSVLDDLDHYIKERLRIKRYLRYMDDFVLIHPDKAYLQYCLAQIRKELAKIGLRLNDKTQIQPIGSGIKWLHWRYALTDTGKVIRKVDKRCMTRCRRRLRRMYAKGVPAKAAAQSYMSWAAHTERRKAKSRNAKRKRGKVIEAGCPAERARQYFRMLYGCDPFAS